jgi:hypothetical protein
MDQGKPPACTAAQATAARQAIEHALDHALSREEAAEALLGAARDRVEDMLALDLFEVVERASGTSEAMRARRGRCK